MSQRAINQILLVVFIFMFVFTVFTSCAKLSDSYHSPIIPLSALFSSANKYAAELSPDGSKIAYMKDTNGFLNIWVKSIDKDDDRVVTNYQNNSILNFLWAYDNEHLIFLRDSLRNEIPQLFSVTVSGEIIPLTPPNRYAKIIALESDFPDEILIQISEVKLGYPSGVYRINLDGSNRKLIYENKLEANHFIADHKFRIRIAVIGSPKAEMALMHRTDDNSEWEYLIDWYKEDFFGTLPIIFGKDNETLYMFSCIGSETSELRSINVITKEEETIASDPELDITGVIFNPKTIKPQVVHNSNASTSWMILDKSFQVHQEKLKAVKEGFIGIRGHTLYSSFYQIYIYGSVLPLNPSHIWLISYDPDDTPPFYCLYNSQTREIIQTIAVYPELDEYNLSEMKPVKIETRDGLILNCLLTIPVGMKPDKLPTVICIHGGPHSVFRQIFNSEVQWLANRGYAVLLVNFRGSTGFGKKFIEAGGREEWGGKMQDDITDATHWLIKEKIADPERIALYGASYGGFSVLCGLAREPDLYACGINLFGASSVKHADYVDFLDEEEKSRSPLYNAEKIKAPLFIVHGQNDPRVPILASNQMVDTLKSLGKEVEYLVFANEGHGLRNTDNMIILYSTVEKFLAKYLGGRMESSKVQ